MDAEATKEKLDCCSGLVMAFASLYGLALTKQISEDSIKYVKDALVGGPTLFHPHHLFYSGIMALVARLTGHGLGDLEGSIRAMQCANVAISAAAVYFFCRVCRQIGAGWGVTLLFTLPHTSATIVDPIL